MFRKYVSAAVSVALAVWPIGSYANPSGADVVAGSVNFSNPDADTLVIQQSSSHSIINWQDFSIGTGETTRFEQPSSAAVSLNRVMGGEVSSILGNLDANGQIFLINPNGVVFGQGAQVNVGGLVATTVDIDDVDFLNGQYQFEIPGAAASIVNSGNITAAEGGLVALVAPTVQNNGTITAQLGRVHLAAGETFILDLYGDQLVNFAVTGSGALGGTLAANSGQIAAAGGHVAMSAAQAADAVNNVINMDGYIAADTLNTVQGKIVLGTGQEVTTVDGTLSARGIDAGAQGGRVDVLGQLVTLMENTTINVDGQAGGGVVHVGGDFRGEGPLPTAENTDVLAGAVISADALDVGNGGEVVIWADDTTFFGGEITARGGVAGGDGGDVEVSGKQVLRFRGDVDTSAPQGAMGHLLLDPQDIVITDNVSEADDAEVGDGTVAGADGGAADFTIAAQALEALAAGTNITLEATRHITLNNLADNQLDLTTTGAVVFRANSNLDGTGDFTMDAGDTIVTGGAQVSIDGVNIALGGIDTSAGPGGNIALAGTAITLNGDIDTNGGNLLVNGAVTLANNATYNTNGADGNLLLASPLDGDFDFTIDNGDGGVQLNTVDINQLVFTSGGDVTLNGNVTVDQALDFTNAGAISALTNIAIVAQDGATRNITFGADNALDTSFQVALTGDTIRLETVGTNTPLDTLTVTANTELITNGDMATVNGVTVNGAAQLGGNVTTDESNINITGPVTLLSAVGLNTGPGGGGNITLGSTVDGGFNLTLAAGTGNVDVTGAVGGSTDVGSVAMSGNTITVGDGVQSTGQQIYTGAATIDGTFVTSDDAVTFLGPVTLNQNTSINTGAGAGDIGFNSTVDGAYDLTLNSGTGAVNFNGNVGSLTPLGNINATGQVVAVGNMTSTGSQDYSGTLSLNGNLNVGSGPVVLGGDVTLLGNSMVTSGGGVAEGISINGSLAGDFALDLVAGAGDLILSNVDVDTLTLTSGDDVTLNGALTTDTALDFSNVDDIIIGTDTVITADNGTARQNVTFDAENTITSAGADLTITGDTLQIQSIAGTDTVTLDGATAVNLANGINTDGAIAVTGATTSGGDFVTTNDNITFNDALVITGNTSLLTGVGGGNITLSGPVNGGFDLVANAGTGNFTSSAVIGGVTPLNTFDVTALNIRVQDVTTADSQDYTGTVLESGLLTGGNVVNMTGDVVLSGGVATSVGNVNIIGNVVLTGDSILQSGGSIADTVNITGGITGDYNLEMRAGLADINISGDVDINQWILTSGDDLTLGSGSFQTDQNMDFTNVNRIVLSADTSFIAKDTAVTPNALADITMGPANVITGPYNLSFEGRTVTIHTVGDPTDVPNTPLSLDIAAQTVNLLGTISTVNEQTYTSLDGLANDLITQGADIVLNTPIDLLGDVTITTGAGGGDIYFGGAINGAHNLVIDAGTGAIDADFDFGVVTPLQSIAMTAATLDLFDITTVGNQTFTGPATLNGNLTTAGGAIAFTDAVAMANPITFDTGNTSGGGVTFGGTFNGSHDVTFDLGNGDITFGDVAGGISRLGNLNILSAGNIDFSRGIYLQSFISDDLTGDVRLDNTVGLNALGDVALLRPSTIQGRIVGENVTLETTRQMVVDVVADTLTVGGRSSFITADVGGVRGRGAVHQIEFTNINGGPHMINGYNAPLLGLVTAPAVLNLTAWDQNPNPLPVVQNTSSFAQASLNPMMARAELIVANGTNLALDFNPRLVGDEDDG